MSLTIYPKYQALYEESERKKHARGKEQKPPAPPAKPIPVKRARPKNPSTPWQQLMRRARAFKQAGIPMTPKPDRRHRYALCSSCTHNRHAEKFNSSSWGVDCTKRPCSACLGIEPWISKARCPVNKW